MKSLVVITEEPINPGEFFSERGGSSCGAAVTFVGMVRGEEGGKKIQGIEYEVYEEMARLEIERIVRELKGRWPVHKAVVLHRKGFVPTGEVATLVQVFSPHRREAFKAAQFIIGRLKEKAPIWKHPR